MERISVKQKKSDDRYHYSKDLRDAVDVCEFIPNRLYFATYKNKDDKKRTLKDTDDTHYFNTDDVLVYTGYFMDFGPLNIGKLYRFCKMLYSKLKANSFDKKKIVYWTSLASAKRANAAYLIGSFAVILLDMSPKEAMNILTANSNLKYVPFNDANTSGYTGIYTIRINDCLSGINKAFYFNMINFADFDLTEYENFEGANPHAEGDLSWIVPQKLLAMAGPCGEKNGNYEVELYLGYFKDRNVHTVIRLNKSKYDSRRFSSYGIVHFDLIFPDGSVPPDEILSDFLEIVENSAGATAVHCKAGLGRTGCLIGTYLMKHYRMSALEAIAWMRICRPGCVIGQQQIWLEQKQPWAWKQGDQYRQRHFGSSEKVRQHKYGIYSIKGYRMTESGPDDFLANFDFTIQDPAFPNGNPHLIGQPNFPARTKRFGRDLLYPLLRLGFPGRSIKVEPNTETERAQMFSRIRDRIAKRRSIIDDFDDGTMTTQGELLVAARNANKRKR